jgi:hypothetical protein
MKENQDAAPEVLARFRQEFASALLWVERIWGDESFKQYKRGTESNPKGHWVRSRYDLIYDVEMIGFGQYGPHLTRFWDDATPGEHTAVRKLLRNRLATVMMGDAFVASMLEGTWRHSAVANRYDPWLHSLEIIVRDFKRAINDGEMLDQTWRDNNNACQICKTPVPIEEAVLIGLGDKKSVVHQYCSRPR